MKRATFSILAFLLASLCVACGSSGGDETPEEAGDPTAGAVGTMSCTVSSTVAVNFGRGSQNGTCSQVTTRFALNQEMWGCSNWACLADGDEIKFEWRRPNASIRDTDVHTFPNGGDRKISFSTWPDITGQWSVKVYRNGNLAASQAFDVF